MKYRKLTLAQVKKIIKEKGVFNGFAVGNKVNESHFFVGWGLAVNCTFNNLADLEKFKNELMIRLERQLGDRLAWYEYM